MAQLCALDLLQAAAGAGVLAPDVTAVGYATPAVGNAALAAHATARGWAGRFVTYLLPGVFKDQVTIGLCLVTCVNICLGCQLFYTICLHVTTGS